LVGKNIDRMMIVVKTATIRIGLSMANGSILTNK
jgi:hypothetical protein